MQLEVFEGKTKEEALASALESLNLKEEDILYLEEEKKGKLFKSATYLVKAIPITTIQDFLKEKVTELLKNMDIEVTLESSIRNQQINIKLYSNKNNILIGRNGQTLLAIQHILRQMVYNKINIYPYILLDVENYKEKKNSYLERNAKKIAKEVLRTKVDVHLDNMNSYERRIVHNALSDFKNISTTSEGEEPNRHIVIKYIDSKEKEE